MMKQFFRGAGTLPCLPDCWFTRAMYQQDKNAVLDKVEKELGYPVFVKPANLGSSIGVSRADDREGLTDSLELAFEYDRRVLVEKGLDHPIELNCSVLGYDGDVEASPIEMPLSGQQFLDFKEKYLANGGSKGMASLHRVLPAPIEDSLRDKIQAMSCDISGCWTARALRASTTCLTVRPSRCTSPKSIRFLARWHSTCGRTRA